MTHTENLKEMLVDAIIPDIEDAMDELFVLIAEKRASADDKEELEELREMRKEFLEIVEEITRGELEEDEALGIIEELEEIFEEDED